jgi:hypothetical protein
VLVRQTQNCGFAVLKRIDELLDRTNALSKDKKTFLTGTISSILRQIRQLFTDKSRSDIRERVSMIKQDSFKTSSGFLSSNPMVAADSRDTNRMGRKDMSTKSAKSGKSGKSSKSGRSMDTFDADDRVNGTPISNTQLEQSMRFVTTYDCSHSCQKLCGQLIAVVLKICTQKPPSGNNSTTSINPTSNTTANNNSSASLRPTSYEQSSRSKQKAKAWDNLLAFEKFLVDEICCFLSEVGGGSGFLPEKWGDALGSIAMQYWRVCDGERNIFEFLCAAQFLQGNPAATMSVPSCNHTAHTARST